MLLFGNQSHQLFLVCVLHKIQQFKRLALYFQFLVQTFSIEGALFLLTPQLINLTGNHFILLFDYAEVILGLFHNFIQFSDLFLQLLVSHLILVLILFVVHGDHCRGRIGAFADD